MLRRRDCRLKRPRSGDPYPDGTIEAQIRDAAAQLVDTKDALGHSVNCGYDPDGRLESLTDENGNLSRWTYDPRGKLSAKIYADGSSERYRHNAAGELIRRTRPDDSTVAYTYNSRSRLLSALWDEDKAAASHFAYDAVGHMTQAKNINSTIDRAYDPVGRLAMETQILAHANNTAFEVGYAYDPDGKLTVLTYPDKSAVHYAWNQRGELSEVSSLQPKASSLQPVASYARRLDGLVERLTHGNSVVTTKTYDAVGRIVTIAHIAPDGTILDGETSRYDAMNRRTARIRPEGTADLFDYDPTGQVIGGKYDVPVVDGDPTGDAARVQGFVYDPAGNRKEFKDGDQKTVYQANGLNQYSAIQLPESRIDEPQFDKSGNLMRDEFRTYEWDADSHLLSVTTKDRSKARYAYDPFHRRVWSEAVAQATVFVHNGWNVIAEYHPGTDTKNSQSTIQIWAEDLSRTLQGAGGIGGLLSIQQVPSKHQEQADRSFFHYDSNGNITGLTNGAAALTASYGYDAFGRKTEAYGVNADANQYQFSTKRIDSVSDLSFYGYRWYDPITGRWASRDPIGEKGGINIYQFVSNSTINRIDVLGLACHYTIHVGHGGDMYPDRFGQNNMGPHDRGDCQGYVGCSANQMNSRTSNPISGLPQNNERGGDEEIRVAASFGLTDPNDFTNSGDLPKQIDDAVRAAETDAESKCGTAPACCLYFTIDIRCDASVTDYDSQEFRNSGFAAGAQGTHPKCNTSRSVACD